MSELNWQNNGTTATIERSKIYLDWSADNRCLCKITAPSLPIYLLPSLIRRKKIHTIRQQFADGPYNMDERLDVTLDRLLEVLNA